MRLKKVEYSDGDFIRIRNFLVETYRDCPGRRNWLIDRWNFCRYVSQSFHKTFDAWPGTVGIWEDEHGCVQAVVNSEGEDHGEAFFQLSSRDFPDELLLEFIEHAERNCRKREPRGDFLEIRVNPEDLRLKKLLHERGYAPLDRGEPESSLPIDDERIVEIPDGFRILDAGSVTDRQKGWAHGRAFGYYRNDEPDDDDAEIAFASMRKAPDYDASLDLSVVDGKGDVAAFATVWYDRANRIGALEPVGTIPEYRKMGLGKAVIFEGINRIMRLGAKKLYVGSDQRFYLRIGFSIEYEKEIWRRTW